LEIIQLIFKKSKYNIYICDFVMRSTRILEILLLATVCILCTDQLILKSPRFISSDQFSQKLVLLLLIKIATHCHRSWLVSSASTLVTGFSKILLFAKVSLNFVWPFMHVN